MGENIAFNDTKMTYLEIYGQQFLASRKLVQTVAEVKALKAEIEPVVVEARSCRRFEIDWYGTVEDVMNRLPKAN